MASPLAQFALTLMVAITCTASLAYSQAPSPSPTAEIGARFEDWMALHGRTYDKPEEKERRFLIFRQNVEFIDSFNMAKNHSFELSANGFTDMTNKEFVAKYMGLKPQKQGGSEMDDVEFGHGNVTHIPGSMDWRQKGAVTAVKNQGNCGGCWAFSAVAALEGITKIKTGKLVSLSEQQLIDCDTENDGCMGGYMVTAFQYIRANGGLSTESNYPYQAADGNCDTRRASYHAASIRGYREVPANNENELLKAVVQQPVSVAIDASGYAFQFYKGGIFSGACGTELNHGVTAVGYGAQDGKLHWLVKNSWGSRWGEGGYVRMERNIGNKEGICGISMMASYPLR
ncbi:hypothetical protein AMTRI_Chr01g111120 [Amborella trichopoda]